MLSQMQSLAATLLILLSTPNPTVAVVVRHEGRPVPGLHLTLEERLASSEHHSVTNAEGVATFPALASTADLTLDSPVDYAFPAWAPLEIVPGQRLVPIDLVHSRAWALRHSPRPCDFLLTVPVISLYLPGPASIDEETHGFVRPPDQEDACRTVASIAEASHSRLPWLLFLYSLVQPPCLDTPPRGIIDVSFAVHSDLVSVAGQDFGRCPDYWVRWWNQTRSGPCLPDTDPEWRFRF